MTILRDRTKLADADMADMIESYNAYTGKSIKKFSSRAAGETQLANAMMAAENEAGKLGVAKGKKPQPMTMAELDAARAAKAMGADVLASKADKPTKADKPAKEGKMGKSLRESLKAKVSGEPNKPKPRAEKPAGAGRSSKVSFVKLTKEGGRSKMQQGSMRKSVYDAVVGKGGVVDVDALQDDFRTQIRGHILKLIFEQHLVACDAEGKVSE